MNDPLEKFYREFTHYFNTSPDDSSAAPILVFFLFMGLVLLGYAYYRKFRKERLRWTDIQKHAKAVGLSKAGRRFLIKMAGNTHADPRRLLNSHRVFEETLHQYLAQHHDPDDAVIREIRQKFSWEGRPGHGWQMFTSRLLQKNTRCVLSHPSGRWHLPALITGVDERALHIAVPPNDILPRLESLHVCVIRLWEDGKHLVEGSIPVVHTEAGMRSHLTFGHTCQLQPILAEVGNFHVFQTSGTMHALDNPNFSAAEGTMPCELKAASDHMMELRLAQGKVKIGEMYLLDIDQPAMRKILIHINRITNPGGREDEDRVRADWFACTPEQSAQFLEALHQDEGPPAETETP